MCFVTCLTERSLTVMVKTSLNFAFNMLIDERVKRSLTNPLLIMLAMVPQLLLDSRMVG